MDGQEQKSPLPSKPKAKQDWAAGTLGCMSYGCAVLGIIYVVPFYGVKYLDWFSSGSGGGDALRTYSLFLWLLGNATLLIGLILGSIGLVLLRRSSGTWLAVRRGWEPVGPGMCAVLLLVSAVVCFTSLHGRL